MEYILEGIKSAFGIILSFDREFMDVVARSLLVSFAATTIATVVAVPFFMFLGLRRFGGEGIVSRLLNTFMSLPTVVVGLVVMLLLARRGPFGSMNLLFTVHAMIIAQVVLVFPLISAMTYELAKQSGRGILNLGLTLGSNPWQATALAIAELKGALFIYVITTFSRAISEVGAVMMVGGNIKGQTNVMTTTISRYNSMGEYDMAIALGIILMLVSCVINWAAYSFKRA
jgi:tungstate transport system permease protein